MKYIAHPTTGYLLDVGFGAEFMSSKGLCEDYTGAVPSGYDSLADWFAAEGEKLYRWKIVDGNLTMDESATKPEAPEAAGGSGPVLLWEQESGYLPNAFEGQSIELDMTPYNAVEIHFARSTQDTKNFIVIKIPALSYEENLEGIEWPWGTGIGKGVRAYAQCFDNMLVDTDYLILYNRGVEVTNEGVRFSYCFGKKVNELDYNEDCSWLIPARIYGIIEP